MKSKDDSATQYMAASPNYREFISRALVLRASSNMRLTYAALARAAGFAARSFPRDVVLGVKNLSPTSCAQMIKGLSLRGDLAELFQLLVEIEHPSNRLTRVPDAKVQQRIQTLRGRIQKTATSATASAVVSQSTFKADSIPVIYAALGDPARGATEDQVVSRTKLTRKEVKDGIAVLQTSGIVETFDRRIRVKELHLNLPGLTQDQLFERFFRSTGELALRSARQNFANPESLFFSSCFSVHTNDLTQLKSELRSVLLKFVDHGESSTGEKVAYLHCSLFCR